MNKSLFEELISSYVDSDKKVIIKPKIRTYNITENNLVQGRRTYNGKRIVTPHSSYNSIAEAHRVEGTHYEKIKKWARLGINGYSYLKEEDNESN